MSRAPERGVPLTAETVGLLQPGDWIVYAHYAPMRVGDAGSTVDSVTEAVEAHGEKFTFLGRPDADGWIAHDGGENPAPGLRVDIRFDDEDEFTDEPSGDWFWRNSSIQTNIIAWRPHVAAAPSPSTAETVVVPIEAAECARLLVQELTPDQGQSASRAFGLALRLQSAIAATPDGSALRADLNDYVTRCIRSTPEASMSLEESLIARAANALSASPAREPEGGAVSDALKAKYEKVKATTYNPGTPAEQQKDGMLRGLTSAIAIAMVEEERAALTPKEAPAAPTCQKCGGEVQGWTCQGCGASFRESDGGALVFDHEAPAATGAGEVHPIRAARIIIARAVERMDQETLDLARIVIDALRAQPQAREEAQPVSLAECPPGLFRWNDTLGFKSEYGAMEPDDSTNGKHWKVSNRPDAYCADSGEYFWGGTSNHEDRAKVLVYPVATPPTQPLAEGADAEKLRMAVEALEPFARLELPKKPVGNAGAWSLLHSDIRRAKEALSALQQEGNA